MEPEIAVRLAAAIVDVITVEEAEEIITEYLTRLATCPVCGGTGRFTFAQDVQIEANDSHGVAIRGSYIPEGTDGPCPLCRDGHGDPAAVAWHCVTGENDRDCQHAQNGGNGGPGPHVDCGYRLILPIPLPKAGK